MQSSEYLMKGAVTWTLVSLQATLQTLTTQLAVVHLTRGPFLRHWQHPIAREQRVHDAPFIILPSHSASWMLV